MGTRKTGQLSPEMECGKRRMQEWRGRRKRGSRIPQTLWTIAVRLAKTHGVSRTASVLGLDFYALKTRVEAAASRPQAGPAPFIELTLTPPGRVGKQCHFELDNGSGAIIRGQLLGYDAADLEALARGFRSDR
jgi:hypothetical protein